MNINQAKKIVELEPLTVGKSSKSKNPRTYIFIAKDEGRFCVFTNERKHFIMTPLIKSKSKETLVSIKHFPIGNPKTLADYKYDEADFETLRLEAINYLLNKKDLNPLEQTIVSDLKIALYNKSSANNETLVAINEQEQDELIKELKKTKRSKIEILNELMNTKHDETDVIEIKTKRFRSDNIIIAQIKYIRGLICQLCGTSILKKNGEYYVEAAHIISKKEKGHESLDNIILLCPNHHKEFDLGKREILEHTNEEVTFLLNEVSYTIKLIPDLDNF